MRNKNTRNLKNLEKEKKIQKKSFISIINDIVFICGYCMLGLNLQLLLVFSIIGNTYMLPI
jgi:hypothetical protein